MEIKPKPCAGKPFEILSRFLDQFAPEVEGRERADPPDEIREKLRAFARGKLSEAEREQLANLLKENPEWVSFLAAEVKTLRRESDSGSE